MVKNKLMTSLLAAALVVVPGVVRASTPKFDEKEAVELAKQAIEDQTTAKKDQYGIEIDRIKGKFEKIKDNKGQWVIDKKKSYELQIAKQNLLKAKNENRQIEGEGVTDDQIKHLQKQIDILENKLTSKAQKVIGGIATGVAALAVGLTTWHVAGSSFSAAWKFCGADKWVPVLFSYGWKTAGVGLCSLVVIDSIANGSKAINKMGRALTNNCVARALCKWWK